MQQCSNVLKNCVEYFQFVEGNEFGAIDESINDSDDVPSTSRKPFFRFVHKCDTFSYCVFASQAIINKIEQNIDVQRRHYLMDATFKVVPLGEFNQFLIIHIEYMEMVKI